LRVRALLLDPLDVDRFAEDDAALLDAPLLLDLRVDDDPLLRFSAIFVASSASTPRGSAAYGGHSATCVPNSRRLR
jgi:hypothetical protein